MAGAPAPRGRPSSKGRGVREAETSHSRPGGLCSAQRRWAKQVRGEIQSLDSTLKLLQLLVLHVELMDVLSAAGTPELENLRHSPTSSYNGGITRFARLSRRWVGQHHSMLEPREVQQAKQDSAGGTLETHRTRLRSSRAQPLRTMISVRATQLRASAATRYHGAVMLFCDAVLWAWSALCGTAEVYLIGRF